MEGSTVIIDIIRAGFYEFVMKPEEELQVIDVILLDGELELDSEERNYVVIRRLRELGGGQCGREVEDFRVRFLEFLEIIEVGKELFYEVAFGFFDANELIVVGEAQYDKIFHLCVI